MARARVAVLRVLAVILAVMVVTDMAAAQCPSALNFRSCLPYVRANGSAPNRACCDVVRSKAWTNTCLCNLAKARIPGVSFQKAIALPKACKRTVPKGSKCNGVTVPR